MGGPIETELKLRIEPARLGSAIKALTRISGRSPRLKRLDAIYFDTATLKLWRSGHAFRVRREGAGFVQTLKGEPKSDGISRSEWSDVTSADTPDLNATKTARRVRRLIGGTPLEPKFRVQVIRRVFAMRGPGGARIEAAVDVGDIVAPNGARTPVCELELELKAGFPLAIYRAALDLAQRQPMVLEPLSKSARGYALLGQKPKLVRLDSPRFRADTPLYMALQQAARRYFAQHLANIPLMMTGDATAVHTMRVAVRRLRSAITAAKPFLSTAAVEKANARLRSIQQSLGNLRDLDVLAKELTQRGAGNLGKGGGRRDLAEWIDDRRQSAMTKARKAVGSNAQAVAWLETMEWAESLRSSVRASSPVATPLRRAVPKMFDRLFKRVQKRGGGIADQTPAELHRLRIACKKLRYGLELFESLYAEKEVVAVLAPLKALQEDLGTLNDTHVARPLLGAKRASDSALRYAETHMKRMERRAAAASAHAVTRMNRLKRAHKFW